jgi:hypothetical protein
MIGDAHPHRLPSTINLGSFLLSRLAEYRQQHNPPTWGDEVLPSS